MQNLYTVVYKGQELILDYDIIGYLALIDDYYKIGKKTIVLSDELTFQELTKINDNLDYYRKLLEDNYYTGFYIIKSYYDPDFITCYKDKEIIIENEINFELNPFFDESPLINKLATSTLNYTAKKVHYLPKTFENFSDIIVAGPKYVNNLLFSIPTEYIDFYSLSENLKELRKALCNHYHFEEDEEKITLTSGVRIVIYKTEFSNIDDLINSFDIDCECCIMNVSSKQIYKNKRAVYAHKYKVNTLNVQRYSYLYYKKICDYMKYGFSIVVANTYVFPFDLNKVKENDNLLTYMIYNSTKISEEDCIKEEMPKIEFPNALNKLKDKGKITFYSPLYNTYENAFINKIAIINISSYNFQLDYLFEILSENGIDVDKILRTISQCDLTSEYIVKIFAFLKIPESTINNLHQALNLIYDYEYFDKNETNEDLEIEELKTKYYQCIKTNKLIEKLSKMFPLKNIVINYENSRKYSETEEFFDDIFTSKKLNYDQWKANSIIITIKEENYLDCDRELQEVKRIFVRLNIGFTPKLIFKNSGLSIEEREELKEYINELKNCAIPFIKLGYHEYTNLNIIFRIISQKLISI